jgi:hypothetical protein
MPTVLACPNCRAPLQVESGRAQTFCTYCGAQVQLDAPPQASAAQPESEPGGPRLAETISIRSSPTRLSPILKAGAALPALQRVRFSTKQDALHIDLVAGDPGNPAANRPLADVALPLPGGATQVHLTVQVDPSGKVTLVLSAEGTDNARRWDGFAVRVA